MPTLKDEVASSATEPQSNSIPELELPKPVGFGDNLPQTEDDAKDVSLDSSPKVENDAKEPFDLLSAVRNAVEPDDNKKTAEATSASTVGISGESTNSPDSKDEPGVEDDSKLPFHQHPRWKQVISERDSYKSDAQQYQQVIGFMEQNNLNAEEVARGMHIMSLIKNNPIKALEALRPTINSLEMFSGAQLPEDIAKRVDDGFLDRESAAELARHRHSVALIEQRRQEEMQRQIAAQNRQSADQFSNAISGAVSHWEAQIKARDADYQTKSQFVADRARALLQQFQPSGPQEAVALAERAYNEVNEAFKQSSPRRQPIRTMTSNSSLTSATPTPKSLRDAIMRAAGM
jgi:hypothetical protein